MKGTLVLCAIALIGAFGYMTLVHRNQTARLAMQIISDMNTVKAKVLHAFQAQAQGKGDHIESTLSGSLLSMEERMKKIQHTAEGSKEKSEAAPESAKPEESKPDDTLLSSPLKAFLSPQSANTLLSAAVMDHIIEQYLSGEGFPKGIAEQLKSGEGKSGEAKDRVAAEAKLVRPASQAVSAKQPCAGGVCPTALGPAVQPMRVHDLPMLALPARAASRPHRPAINHPANHPAANHPTTSHPTAAHSPAELHRPEEAEESDPNHRERRRRGPLPVPQPIIANKEGVRVAAAAGASAPQTLDNAPQALDSNAEEEAEEDEAQ